MADIRVRAGRKGKTYQVRYANAAAEGGYAYETFGTLKEARAFLEGGQIKKNRAAGSSDVRTVKQGLQLWLDVCEKEGRNGRDPVTKDVLKNYQWRRDSILKYDWTKTLQELRAPDIVEFRSWLLRTYSQHMAQILLLSFHSMVLELLSRGIINFDFVAGVTIRSSSRYDEPVLIPTEAEVHELLAAADRLANSKNKQIRDSWKRYRPMLYLAADSGMRPQEYLVISEGNLREDGVQVERALESGDRKITVTKTPAGRRFIDLSADTLDMVRHYSRTHGVPASKNKHGLVFPTDTGRWQAPDNWRKRGFAAACEEAGLGEEIEVKGETVFKPRYTPYSLRHFYASMLIEQRTNLKRIQKLMGHEKIETTLNFYGHLIERKEAETEVRTGMLASLRQNSCGKSVASLSEAAE